MKHKTLELIIHNEPNGFHTFLCRTSNAILEYRSASILAMLEKAEELLKQPGFARSLTVYDWGKKLLPTSTQAKWSLRQVRLWRQSLSSRERGKPHEIICDITYREVPLW
ncbi:MAG TPA: hypothetical protein V6D17_13330 [Candidatus Obscuribacterales bacterium]